MNSHIKIPGEIDEKLRKNHNLLSKQIIRTQSFLIFQQMYGLMLVFSLIFPLILGSMVFSIVFFFFTVPPFIGLVSFVLYNLIRFIKETIVIRREYFLKEKQNINYLSEEIMMMVKIYTTKFRFPKWSKLRDPLFQDNKVSIVVKMRLILKHEKYYVLYNLFMFTILLPPIIMSDFTIWFIFYLISLVFGIISSYFILNQTNKWMNGYHELNAWGDILDKYEIIPKQRYMALLDKDLNNLEISSNEYCGKCDELLEPNAQFCRFCGRRNESN